MGSSLLIYKYEWLFNKLGVRLLIRNYAERICRNFLLGKNQTKTSYLFYLHSASCRDEGTASHGAVKILAPHPTFFCRLPSSCLGGEKSGSPVWLFPLVPTSQLQVDLIEEKKNKKPRVFREIYLLLSFQKGSLEKTHSTLFLNILDHGVALVGFRAAPH